MKELIKRAEIAESGSSVSLADAELITTTNVRFPSSARAAEEQLYGWSILLDIFHGVLHPVALSAANMVVEIIITQ